MRAALAICAFMVIVAACAGTPVRDGPEVFPTPPTTGSVDVTTEPGENNPPGPPRISPVESDAWVNAVEIALLALGLEGSVAYDEDAQRIVAEVAGPTVYNNAELAELLITIVSDPDQPSSITITHSQLKVRIRVDPDAKRPCTCGFR